MHVSYLQTQNIVNTMMINFKKGLFAERELFGKNKLLNIKDDIFNVFDKFQ